MAVYNFSDAKHDGRQILDYTRHRKKIYQALCHYFGGGTRLNIDDIEFLQDPFKRSMNIRKNISVYSVKKKEDIPKIVLGKIQEYFKSVS